MWADEVEDDDDGYGGEDDAGDGDAAGDDAGDGDAGDDDAGDDDAEKSNLSLPATKKHVTFIFFSPSPIPILR